MENSTLVTPRHMARNAIRWAIRNFKEAAHRVGAAERIIDGLIDESIENDDAPLDEDYSRWGGQTFHAARAAEFELVMAIHTAGGSDGEGRVDMDDMEKPRAVVIGGEVYVTYLPDDGRDHPIVIRIEKDRVTDLGRRTG
jgi:hypothetical protein